MTKDELTELIDSLEIPASEGAPKDEDVNKEVRVYFWEYNWEDIISSGSSYDTTVRYQISFIANRPRHPKLLELKRKLNKKEIFPVIQHEHLLQERQIHSFFYIDIVENLGEQENVK